MDINKIKLGCKVAKITSKVAFAFGIDTVVRQFMCCIMAPDAKMSTKIMMRIGGAGISMATTAIVSKEVDETIDEIVRLAETNEELRTVLYTNGGLHLVMNEETNK